MAWRLFVFLCWTVAWLAVVAFLWSAVHLVSVQAAHQPAEEMWERLGEVMRLFLVVALAAPILPLWLALRSRKSRHPHPPEQ